jgi:hypothetical protein
MNYSGSSLQLALWQTEIHRLASIFSHFGKKEVESCLCEKLKGWKSVIIDIGYTNGNEIEVVCNLGSLRADGDGLRRRRTRPSRGESTHSQCHPQPM